MNELIPELKLHLLSFFGRADLVAYSQTSSQNRAFVREHYKGLFPPHFFAERLPEAVPKDKVTLAREAISLLPASLSVRIFSLFRLAQKVPQDEQIPILRAAFEEAELLSQKNGGDTYFLPPIVKAVASRDPQLARRLAEKITHTYSRSFALHALDDSELSCAAAFDAAKALNKPDRSDFGLEALVDRFSRLHMADAIHNRARRAKAYFDLAKKCLVSDPAHAETLFLQAIAIEELHEYTYEYFIEALVQLRNLRSSETGRVFALLLDHLDGKSDHTNHYYRTKLVEKLKTVDIDMAREAALPRKKREFADLLHAFTRLMSIAEANRESNLDKACEIVTQAVELKDKIVGNGDQIVACIQLANWYASIGDIQGAARALHPKVLPVAFFTDVIWLANVASRTAPLDPKYANLIVESIISKFDERVVLRKIRGDYYATIQLLYPHFPEQAKTLLQHTVRTLSGDCFAAEFERISSLVVEMNVHGKEMNQLLYEAAMRHADIPMSLLYFAVALNALSQSDAIALFKHAYRVARINRSYEELMKCAQWIAPLYPLVAAGLFQEAHELDQTAAAPLLSMAKCSPQHALAIYAYALPLIKKDEERHCYTLKGAGVLLPTRESNLDMVVKAILE